MAKKPEKRPTWSLKLTQLELLHLRDLFGVALPPETSTTVSQGLATAEGRQLIEARLWSKLAKACRKADVPLGDDAPDFIIVPSGMPTLGVFRMADSITETSDADEGAEEPAAVGDPFEHLTRSKKEPDDDEEERSDDI